MEKALRKIRGEDDVLHVVYEAGPIGFVLYRRLQQAGVRVHRGGAVAHAAAEGRAAGDEPAL